MKHGPELLLPAGDLEKMRYALAWGADAVYLGIPKYSLRARENGMNRNAVVEAVAYAHSLNRKVYLTANILPHNHKVDPFLKYVGELLEQCKPNAWIMSDPGIIMAMREQYPEQIIHLSVQANTVNYASAKFWHKLGVSRIILSRELTLKEIARIHQECPELELEAFVHGAICIAYSGRCLISNYMTSRDPNQGVCSHSCRWEYKLLEEQAVPPNDLDQVPQLEVLHNQQGDEYQRLSGSYFLEEADRPGQYMPIDEDEHGTYLMNAKDLCGIEYLEELQAAGVCSFKVEGRSKSPYYVATIARAYRQAIESLRQGQQPTPEVLDEVNAVANRGYISGFLAGNPGAAGLNYETTQSAAKTHQFSALIRSWDGPTTKAAIDVRGQIRLGMTLELVTPEKTVAFEVKELWDPKGDAVEILHSGLVGCGIGLPSDPSEFGMLRERLSETVQPSPDSARIDAPAI